MKTIAFALLSWCVLSLSFSSEVDNDLSAIHPFTPNVVDPDHHLQQAEVKKLNQKIEELKNDAQILGAVYIVNKIPKGFTIETLALKAFEKWELGEKGKDNGLLLVLAIDDRQSRIEVGYGLEATIPDVIAKRALDEALAPKMRAGKKLEAISATLDYVSTARLGGELPADQNSLEPGVDILSPRFIPYWIYVLMLWFAAPLLWSRKQKIREPRLQSLNPEITKEFRKFLFLEGEKKWGFPWPVKIFLMVNPGLFFIFLLSEKPNIGWFVMALFFLIVGFVLRNNYKKFRAIYEAPEQALMSYFEVLKKKYTIDPRLGYVEETASGQFRFKEGYFKSPEYRSWKATQRSSSGGSRSSSGGGRSGGGGASSRW